MRCMVVVFLVVCAALASACVVNTSAGEFDCLWTPNGVKCERIVSIAVP